MSTQTFAKIVVVLGLACVGGLHLGCPSRSQLRDSALPAHKPTVSVLIQGQARDPRWQSFLQGAAHEVLMQEGYEVLARPSQAPGTSGTSPHAALLRSVGVKPMPQGQAAATGAELTFYVRAWTVHSRSNVRGMATVKLLEQPNRRVLGSATASGRPASASSQTGALQSTKEAVQLAIRRASRHYYTQQRRSVRVGGSYEVHIIHRQKLGDLDDHIVLKLRRSGFFTKVMHITSGDRKALLRCHSRHSPAVVRGHLRKILRQIPAINSVRTPTSWRRVVVLLLNQPR